MRLYGVAIWLLFTIYINMYNQVYKSSTVKKKITMWNRLGVDMIGEINNNFFFQILFLVFYKALSILPYSKWIISITDHSLVSRLQFLVWWLLYRFLRVCMIYTSCTDRTPVVFQKDLKYFLYYRDTTCSIAPLLGFELCSLGFKIYNSFRKVTHHMQEEIHGDVKHITQIKQLNFVMKFSMIKEAQSWSI